MANLQSNVTHLVEGDYLDIWQCNDCGAYADTEAKIVHYETCRPGESQEWEDYYQGVIDHYEDKENEYYDTRW